MEKDGLLGPPYSAAAAPISALSTKYMVVTLLSSKAESKDTVVVFR
jgi:hypothetical protein